MEEAIVPDIYDPSQIDMQEMVESEEAIAMAREIIAREAIFAGMSSGAAMITSPNPVMPCMNAASPMASAGKRCACQTTISKTTTTFLQSMPN